MFPFVKKQLFNNNNFKEGLIINILNIKRDLNIIKLQLVSSNNIIDNVSYQIKNLDYENDKKFLTTILPFFKNYYTKYKIMFFNDRQLLNLFVKLLKICIREHSLSPIKALVREKNNYFYIYILDDFDPSIISDNRIMTLNLFTYFDNLVLIHCWNDIGKHRIKKRG